jgi:3-deoxy-D-manno-octulosonate 8-phosphate phosphatase (KDO 8-P phosphatase)
MAVGRDDIDLIVFDFDGVMTDNTVYVFEDGREAVRCNRADGLGCDLLRGAGVAMMILSTETNTVVAARARKLKLEAAHGSTDKGKALAGVIAERGLDAGRVMYVGNDLNDLGAMQLVSWPVAPADAHPQIRAMARLVTQARGGEGVVRELADVLLD